PYLYEAYRATTRRAPKQPLIPLPHTLSEITGPGPALSAVNAEDSDLTTNMRTATQAMGQPILVTSHAPDAGCTQPPNPHTPTRPRLPVPALSPGMPTAPR